MLHQPLHVDLILLSHPEDIEDGQIVDVSMVREKLNPYTEKKRINLNTIGFVPIEKVEISMERPSCRLIYIKKCYVKEMDIMNTLSYLSKHAHSMEAENPLYLRKNANDIHFNTWEDDEHFIVRIRKDILHLIQYGFSASVLYVYRVQSYINVPSYGSILRCFTDQDDYVLKHGIKAIFNLLTNIECIPNVKHARLLPTILEKIGHYREKYSGFSRFRFPWDKHLFKGFFSKDNHFIRSLIALIMTPQRTESRNFIPWNVYISQEGINQLKRWTTLPDVFKVFLYSPTKSRKNGDYDFSSMHEFYYQWMVENVKDKDILEYFMYVYVKHDLKTNKKRKRNLKRNDRRTDPVDDVYKEQIEAVSNSVYEKPDGIWILSYLLLYLHMRNEETNMGYSGDTGKFEDIREHAHHYSGRIGAYPVVHLCSKNRDYHPVVTYPFRIGKACGQVNESFPIIKMKDDIYKEIEDIGGDLIKSVFYNSKSFRC